MDKKMIILCGVLVLVLVGGLFLMASPDKVMQTIDRTFQKGISLFGLLDGVSLDTSDAVIKTENTPVDKSFTYTCGKEIRTMNASESSSGQEVANFVKVFCPDADVTLIKNPKGDTLKEGVVNEVKVYGWSDVEVKEEICEKQSLVLSADKSTCEEDSSISLEANR